MLILKKTYVVLKTKLKRFHFVLVAGFLVSLIISHPAWFQMTSFPTVELIPFTWDYTKVVITGLSILLMALNIAYLVRPFGRLVPHAIFVVLLVIMGLDRNLLQPWVWMYFLMLWALLPLARQHYFYRPVEPVVRTLQVIVAGVYVFSGLHKFNPQFESVVVPYMLRPITYYIWQIDDLLYDAFTQVRWLELLCGLALINPFLSKWAKYPLIAMHLFVLVILSPLGLNTNYVIWPWNVQMIFFLWVLFPRKPLPTPPVQTWIIKMPYPVILGVMFVFGCLPFFMPGANNYMAFDLYSRKAIYPEAKVERSALRQLPGEIEPYSYNKGDTVVVNYQSWFYAKTNLPPCSDKWGKGQIQKEIGSRITGPGQSK